MDSTTIDTFKHVSNTEVIRRLLIKYFFDKGFHESFDKQLYPALIQDMPYTIPILTNKIEIVPYAEEIDSTMGKAKLGWNMFILGNHRMYLGETYHNNLKDLARQIQSGMILPPNNYSSARRQTTPRRIVTFVTRVMGDHKQGYTDLSPSSQPPEMMGQAAGAKNAMMGASQQFFSR